MKKEIPPALIVTVLVLVLGGVIAFFVFGGNADSRKVDIKTLDPELLRDPDPRGDPNMRARPEGE
jgi:flagellar basal body-associated protein FliL